MSLSTSFSQNIRAAAADYMDVADSNPQTMGKKPACYSRLLEITQLYAELNSCTPN